MTNPRAIIGWLIGAGVVALFLSWFASLIYFKPAAKLQADIKSKEDTLVRFADNRRDLIGFQEELQKFADRTLGSRDESVVHRLRTSLTTLAYEVGLKEVAASDGPRRIEDSPAKIEIRRDNKRRNTPDFIEQEGVVTGVGTLEQAMRLVHRIESEPWHKRIQEVKLDPNDNGTTFDVTVRLATLYLPDYSPRDNVEKPPYNAASFDKYLTFTQTNPFRIPPPEPVKPEPAKPEPTKPRPGPAPFPYGEWVVTGLAEGSNGPEVLLRRGKESRRLSSGEKLHEFEFVAYVGDQAEFVNGERRFLVRVGRSLGDRTPVNQ